MCIPYANGNVTEWLASAVAVINALASTCSLLYKSTLWVNKEFILLVFFHYASRSSVDYYQDDDILLTIITRYNLKTILWLIELESAYSAF